MRKSIFVLAVLFSVTFATAQITLETSFSKAQIGPQVIVASTYGDYNECGIFGAYISSISGNNLIIYDLTDFQQVGLITTPLAPKSYYFLSRNIFTTNNKFTYIGFTKSTTDFYESPYTGEKYDCEDIHLYDERGNIIVELGTCFEHGPLQLLKIGDSYKLAITRKDDSIDIYSLPGNGEANDIKEITAPHRNAKYIHNDQVLIDSNERTYNVKGQQVK